jgi:MGT family glycosyltransferase
MSRVLVLTWESGGGLPTLGVARRLCERGHDVRVLSNPTLDRRYGRRGWRFIPFLTTPDYDATAVVDAATEFQVKGRNLWFNPAVGRDLEAELAREPADALLVDCMLFAGVSAAVETGIPTVALFHQSYSAYTRRAGHMLTGPLNAARTAMGLESLDSLAELYSRCACCAIAVPRELEDAELDPPSNIRWVGQVLDEVAPSGATPRLELGDDRVLLISMGTTYQAQLRLLQRIVDAMGRLPVRALVTTGPAVARDSLALPSNVTSIEYVHHDAVLPQTSLVITHAGLGSVLAALRHGLPLLCLPLGRDQFANAEWVKTAGVGRTLSSDASVDMIVDSIAGLLDQAAPERAAANAMKHIFDGYGGADAAVDALESVVANVATKRFPAPCRG